MHALPALDGLPVAATGFLILFARVGAVLMLLPMFSDEAVPARIRLMIALAMSAGLWGIVGYRTLPAAHDAAALPAVLIAELLVGLAIGMIIRIMFLAAAMAGSIISLQVGVSSALINDPAQGGQSPLLSKFVSVGATVVCLSFGVHHLWIMSIVNSYALFPITGLPPAADFARLAVDVAGRSMALAIGLAAPLLVYGIVFNVALGLASRLAPAIQIFFLVQPLNILLGVAVFATILGSLLLGFSRTMVEWLQMSWV